MKKNAGQNIKNKEKGITLIGLIVTVIVLLLLAGIGISMLLENNIIEQTGKAKESTEISNEKEVLETSVIQAIGKNKHGKLIKSNLEEFLDKNAGEGKTTVSDSTDGYTVIFTESNRVYNVDIYGNVQHVTSE